MKLRFTMTLLLTLMCGLPAHAADYPPDSVYQLDVELHGHEQRNGNMDINAGGYTLVTMFYGSCPHVCPMLISTMQMIDRELDDAQRAKLRVLMVSLDAERDTPQSLAELARERNVDAARWTLASADANDVRKIAAALRIRFRKLGNGNFNHTSEIILLDLTGREVARSDRLGRPDPDFVAALVGHLD